MRRINSLVLLSGLAACGGGGESTDSPTPAPPTSQRVSSGAYGITIDEQAGAFNGTLITGSSDEFVYSSRAELGFGAWSYTNGHARTSLTRLTRLVDDLGNEFPAGKSKALQRRLDLEPTGATSSWAGGGVIITPNSAATAPALLSIPRNWRFSNLYRFGGMFLDYTVQFDIDTGGVLTGFDTLGCNFTGELAARTDGAPVYDVRVVASNCGATTQFVENAEYRGHAYVRPGPAPGHTVLVIDAVNRTQEGGLGISLTLMAR